MPVETFKSPMSCEMRDETVPPSDPLNRTRMLFVAYAEVSGQDPSREKKAAERSAPTSSVMVAFVPAERPPSNDAAPRRSAVMPLSTVHFPPMAPCIAFVPTTVPFPVSFTSPKPLSAVFSVMVRPAVLSVNPPGEPPRHVPKSVGL